MAASLRNNRDNSKSYVDHLEDCLKDYEDIKSLEKSENGIKVTFKTENYYTVDNKGHINQPKAKAADLFGKFVDYVPEPKIYPKEKLTEEYTGADNNLEDFHSIDLL